MNVDEKNAFSRMTEKSQKPTQKEIFAFIGEATQTPWTTLTRFLEEQCAISPETIFYGKKYGWTLRYRKSGRTFCSLFPERHGFSVLLVLGEAEVEKTLGILDELTESTRQVINTTKQLHDGRWLWIRVASSHTLEDIKRLLRVKRKPNKR